MAHPVSPLAVPLPELAPIKGMRLAVGEAGIRYKGRPDVLFAEMVQGSTVAGVFTSNRCPGAPVDFCRMALERTRGHSARALVVNAGNANVFTGRAGAEAAARTAAAAAGLVGCTRWEVMLASTGVIGQTLEHSRITGILPQLHRQAREDAWGSAAKAIMTTDTFPKGATRTATIGAKTVTITGIAKGSGMIAPDMATMLCFVATDAKIPAAVLARHLRRSVAGSFNCTTVDSDTSTSDTVLLFATGQADHPRVTLATASELLGDFARALDAVLMDLALAVVRDGEGASKLIRIDVRGARSAELARRVALAIANSPLVKTAIAGEDANWGRVVMAIGKSGEPVNRDRVSVAMGGVWMARDGTVVDGYDETPVVRHIKGREVHIEVGLGAGRGEATVHTCDLTHGYIDINGSYRS